MGTPKTERETLPPSAPDAEAADFEREVRERGEPSARWDRLMALLEGEASWAR